MRWVGKNTGRMQFLKLRFIVFLSKIKNSRVSYSKYYVPIKVSKLTAFSITRKVRSLSYDISWCNFEKLPKAEVPLI